MDARAPNTTPRDRQSSRLLFLLLLLLVGGLHLVLLADHRLPRRHRTRLRYELQYSLLSLAGTPGSVPLWLPAASHGVLSQPAVFEESGLLGAPLLLLGRAARGCAFDVLFHLGVLAEELLLLVGVWLLSRRLFRSPLAAFFTGVSAAASAFWHDEIDLNLHAIAALPLVLALLHRFFDQGSRLSLFLAGNLAALQFLGGPPGAGFVCPAAAVLYFAGRRLVLGESLPRRLEWKPLAGGLAVFLPVALEASWGAASLRSAAEGARPAWTQIVVYSGLGNPARYLDLLLGICPSLDWTLYSGLLTLGLAGVALGKVPRAVLGRLALAFPAGLLALGTLLFLLFLAFPSWRPPRPLPYGMPLARLFLAFLAGGGFQIILEAGPMRSARFSGRALAGASLLLAVLSAAAALSPESVRAFLERMVSGETPDALRSGVFQPSSHPEFLKTSLVPDLLGAAALLSGLSGGVLLLVAAGGRTRPFAVALLLALHPLDAFGWKYRTAWLESLPLGPGQRRLQRIEASPYVPRRVASIVDAPRFQEFHREDPYYLDAEESRAPRERWPSAGFWSTDAVEGPGRAEYWMKPWERLATALGGTPEGGERDSCWKRSPGELLSGLDEDKIQFFAGAAVLPAEEIERRLGGSGPFPDVLYVEGGPSGDRAAGSSRLRLPCRVTAWEADRLAIELEVPAGGAWLYYADAWDPCWSATVNGVPREIARANLAYKALWLEGGAGRVEFRATSPLRTACGLLLGLHQAFWLVGILWAAFRLAGGGRSAP